MSQPRVLVFERTDPTDESLDWLERQGMAVTRGRVMWEPRLRRHTEAEIVAEAADYVAVMGASGAHFIPCWSSPTRRCRTSTSSR